MTPDELRSLADATDGILHTEMLSEAELALLALAPDLARLCAELGEALEQSRRARHDHTARSRYCDGCHADDRAQVALAKLSKLEK